MPKNKLFLLALLLPLVLVVLIDLGHLFRSLDHKILLSQQKFMASTQDQSSPIVLIRTGKNFEDKEVASFLDNILLTQAVIPFVPSVVTFESFFNNLLKEDDSYIPQFVKRTHRLNQAILAAQIPPVADSNTPPPTASTFQTLPFSGDLTQLPDYQYLLTPSKGVADAGWLGVDFLPYNQKKPLEKVSLFFRINDKIYPSLALLTYAKFRRVDLSKSKIFLGNEIILCNTLGGMLDRIPLDENNQSWLLFHSHKPYSNETDIPTVILSSEQSYQGAKATFDLSLLRKKILIVEKNTPQETPKILTPLGNMSSTEIHAEITNSLLQHYFISEASALVRLLLISFIGCFGFWTFCFLKRPEALILLIVNLAVIFFVSNWILQTMGVWVPLTSIYLSLLLCSGGAVFSQAKLSS